MDRICCTLSVFDFFTNIKKHVEIKPETPPSGNVKTAEYSSSSDEEDPEMSPYRESASQSDSTKIIAEAQRILYSRESVTDEGKGKKANCIARTTIEMNGILVKKVNNNNSYEKNKKSVRFNMDKIQLHEYTLDTADSISSISFDDGAFIANVLDASDLLASDSELSEDDATDSPAAREDVKFAFSDTEKRDNDDFDPTSSIDSFNSEDLGLPSLPAKPTDDPTIENLSQEKEKLQNDIVSLRAEYDKEMKKLREEYQTRRESYMTELDELRQSIDERLNSSYYAEKMKSYEQEKQSMENLEEDLLKRKKQCLEREEEIEEYEQYLDKRHASLNDKENDLNTLQDELEEFSRLLRKREKELKAKSERIENEYNKEISIKACTHDEKEIQGLREKVRELQNSLVKTKITVEKKEENCRDLENELNKLKTDHKKLQGKVKSLESQLLVDKKINEAKEDCNNVRRTSVMQMGSLASQRFNSEIRSPPANHKPLSARNSQLRPPMQGSALGSDLFLNSSFKRKISEATETSSDSDRISNTTTRVDSRTVKSRTCVVM
ncbi:putative leucine-rich repeat-containing protein DDB_G0290503 isoform X2 [Rhopilema esculentum]|uniref:putative leucine-rich repeat-containing protein DDB_G0290503 isoform X2 n=1 Tax=Rhopilema esculentum TaxID=499914 RepID=UPI0031D304AB